MAATDLVPCFYTGQDYRWERPAKVLTRADVRQLKTIKIGKFVESGKVFIFFKRLTHEEAIGFWDGPLGRGNILPFARPHNYGEKLHYEMPRAGDKGMRRHGLYRRRDNHGVVQVHSKEISVSSRNLFCRQPIPARPLAAQLAV